MLNRIIDAGLSLVFKKWQEPEHLRLNASPVLINAETVVGIVDLRIDAQRLFKMAGTLDRVCKSTEPLSGFTPVDSPVSV